MFMTGVLCTVCGAQVYLLELCPFWNLKYCKYTVFRTFLLHALTYWVEILHMTLFYFTTDQVRVSSIFVWVMPLLELRILKIYSFPHFFLTCFDLLSWKFAHGFVLLKSRSTSTVINLRQFFVGVMPLLELWILEIRSLLFSYMLWHIELKFFMWLSLMYYRSSLSVVTLCPSFLSEI